MLTPAAIAGADRQRAGVEVGAVAEVLEHVLGLGERRLADPGRAFAAHLGEGVGAAVHPRAPCSGSRCRPARASLPAPRSRCCAGSRSRSAARAGIGARQRQLGAFSLAVQEREPLLDALGLVWKRGDALGDHAGDARRRQLVGRGQDPVAGSRRTCRRSRGRTLVLPVVQLLLHLALDEGALLLDDEDLLQALGELAHALGLQRPGHADLVDADADVGGMASSRPR